MCDWFVGGRRGRLRGGRLGCERVVRWEGWIDLLLLVVLLVVVFFLLGMMVVMVSLGSRDGWLGMRISLF